GGNKKDWNNGLVESWSVGIQVPIAPIIQYTITRDLLSFRQHSLQRAVFSKRLGPADVFLEFGAGFDQVLKHVLDAFVGDDRAGFEEARVAFHGLFRDRRIFFAHPLGEGLFGEGVILFDQRDGGHVGAEEIVGDFGLGADEGAAAGHAGR